MSIRLALEWSSPRISVAVENSGVVTERVAEMDRFRAPDALGLTSELFREMNLSEGDIREIRIGRGPGNYTGIRQSIALALGCALPDGLPIRLVNSAAVLAAGLQHVPSEAWVLGDARRGMWWGGRRVTPEAWHFELHPPEVWRENIGTAAVYSSETDRLSGLNLHQAFPSAADLLGLPDEKLTEPQEPLYLHKAV